MSHRLKEHRHQLSDRDLLLFALEQGDDLMANLADVQAALSTLSAKVDSVSAAVAAGFAASANVDLQPALDQVAEVSAKLDAIPTHG